MFAVYYKGIDAQYPHCKTAEDALKFYLDEVQSKTGESKDEILSEDWCSPRGVEKCVKVVEV